jgi:hypothetical protein
MPSLPMSPATRQSEIRRHRSLLPHPFSLLRASTTALLAWTLSAAAPSGAAPPKVVGDANGDGAFSVADVQFAIDALRHGWSRPNPLGDVAPPCDGVIGPIDGQRLLAAHLSAASGIRVRSRCHGAAGWPRPAIGDPVPPALPAKPPLVTLDDQFQTIAKKVPQFAGLHMEGGRLVVSLTDVSEPVRLAALDAIGRTFGSRRFETRDAVAVPASYRFPQLVAWKAAATALLPSGRINLIDADERRNRVRIGLSAESDRVPVENALVAAGVPRAALFFEVRRPVVPLLDPLTTALRAKQRPLVGGLAIESSAGGCSIGFLAKWFGGPRGFVTASHCLPPIGNSLGPGLQVFQDGYNFSGAPVTLEDSVGIEAVDPPFSCGSNCRRSDAVFVGIEDGETGRLGRLAGTPHAPPPASWFGHYDVVGKGLAVCGDEVVRVGASFTQNDGEVDCTCCTEMSAGMTWNCQTGYVGYAEMGDSGGPVFRPVGPDHDAELLGVLQGSADGWITYSPIANIESEIGTLDVTVGDEAPEIQIVAPLEGSSLGGGAFPVAELEAEVFDFEEGGDCAGCTVTWFSSRDGGLGTTPWIDGASELDAVLGGGSGFRAITATAHNAASQTASDTIVVSSGNSAPDVSMDWPEAGSVIRRGVPYQLQASSFDAESFQALPCASLKWTIVGPSSAFFPTTGCFPFVTFEATGTHILTVQGKDDGDLVGVQSRVISVTDAPPGSPAVITFWSPAPHQAFAFDSSITVSATITRPDGSSAPILLWWVLTSPELITSVPAVSTPETIASGGSTSITFRPSDFLHDGCGEAPMTVSIGTGAPGATSASLPLGAMRPPC